MLEPTTIYDLHGRILRDTFDIELSDLDAFLLFAIFHHYQIELDGSFLTDRPQLKAGDRIHADTQRGCSASLASIWEGIDDERANDFYWYRRWNGCWNSYGRAENLSLAEKERLSFLLERLEEHPFVRRLLPEDGGLLSEAY